ncbi:alpha/beta hydrolase [Acrocarpospora pleiomorpha]|uniref:Alpha/beta hydrolase n=1 Tax=Acrocarpospora pleiomorpha TaxID=90975 RepID=A0A5M3XK69_9ACTN|nr:alpha/beta hydrolase [Acrocarpospora pleiomorpha]GES19533.1 alpha/beta hydrolase [Acrocarpospora pleiomorpha]
MKVARTRRRQVLIPLALSMIATVGTAPAQAATRSSPFPCHAPGAEKPIIILVHGAWAGTSSWNGEVNALQEAGYVARAVPNPLRNLTTDAAAVAEYLKTVSGPIVLVGHSYGGSVITNAAAGNPNVKALVYVDATAPDIGETTGQLSGAGSVLNENPASLYYDVSYPGAPAGAKDLYLRQEIFVRSFASDQPQDIAMRLWASQRPVSTSAFTTPSKAAAWKTIPSWFFISDSDQIITPASKLAMAHRAHAKITEFPGGSHLTLISHPDEVTATIASAVCSVR